MIDTQEVKRRVSLIDLASKYTELRRESASEHSGPCPRCGGRDRFHATEDWFFCRQCHEKRGDVIEFVTWINGVGFREAAAMLEPGADLPEVKQAPAPKRKPAKRKPWDSGQKAALLASQQERLFESERGEPGREYLLQRGLEPETWLAFGLGFNPNALGRGPAIALPWYRAGELVAIRYRLLEPVGEQKLISEKGSRFSGLLFGGQALERGAESRRALVLCEGELNAMSVWQTGRESLLDVLSTGSESARLTPAMIEHARRYHSVFAWFDKGKIAKSQALQLGAHAIGSPDGQDANDMLQAGSLGYASAYWRLRACQSAEQRERLYADLFDACSAWQGADAGTGEILQRLAGELGREVQFSEQTDSKVWISKPLHTFVRGLSAELARRKHESTSAME